MANSAKHSLQKAGSSKAKTSCCDFKEKLRRVGSILSNKKPVEKPTQKRENP